MSLYIGLMSGTSMDGVDAVLCRIQDQQLTTLSQVSLPFPAPLLKILHQLCTPGENELVLAGQADREIAFLYRDAVKTLLKNNNLRPADITALGSHGQTVRHHPDVDPPFTLQLGDPNTLAASTNIAVVADFRRKDIALGGQGAPLVPAFHQFQFGSQCPAVIVNIGGIANISVLRTNLAPLGFDTGPGNTLMDAWIRRHQGIDYDADGRWAASGTVNEPLLKALLADPYFDQPGPKSTGREYFNLAWLDAILAKMAVPVEKTDVQATLCALTAQSISHAIGAFDDVKHVYICGGGAFNQHLMQMLSAQMAPLSVSTTKALGIHPQWVEGAAFAWLAHANIARIQGSVSSVTGASRPAVLGGLFLPD
ncbi:anhydro-N-acetylmuramic acid kinase [Salinimonas sp. HHU 13199]|uniref:Anhydro-N-acetylmuramic acid kinase n=1 Tax=Salinimonas profundi TaxID=2729140 RepID=A0ABR8LKA9_9ALTE|nr:anhydro-N-acetylmuramic acid kinase [Salinimonas profundi]MBD3586192.1 anhydro-N-acetylmuramic acid kinase [Salinimonas profundi]